MDLELHKKLRVIKEERNKNYIKSKLKNIRGNNNIENITLEESKLVLDSIREDYNKEKNNIIDETIELFYNNKKYKKLVNKDKYINKIKKHLYIIECVKDYLRRTHNINNDYSLYYCKYQALELIDVYKNKKEILKPLKYLMIRFSILEQKYSDVSKEFYKRTENYEELKKIRTYEAIGRNIAFEKLEQTTNTINAMDKNVKVLKYNCDQTVDKGFFGL